MTKKKTMAKKVTKKATKSKRDADLEAVAKLAAKETLLNQVDESFLDEEEEEDDMELNFSDVNAGTPTASAPTYDIFEEAHRLAQSEGDIPKFLIKKDGQMIGTMYYPCSWETIQKRYGGGYYQVQARRASNGLILKNATEMIAALPDEEGIEEPSHDSSIQNQPSFLEFMTLLNSTQEKAEQKARDAAASAQSANAMMMQSMMQMQQQSQQQFQMMIIELNKQSQAQSQQQQTMLTTLMTSLLSKKESGDGFTAASVMKMVQDAARDAESRTKGWFELVEKKAEALAEEKAQAMDRGEEDESLTKSVIKGFIPLLSQVMVNQGGGQAPAQQPPRVPVPSQPLQAPRQVSAPLVKPNPAMPQNMAPKVVTPEVQKPIAPQQATKLEAARPVGPVIENKAQEKSTKSEELPVKEQIINLLKMDIGQAFMLKRSASGTAEACLKKLEKKGISRQTVLDVFTLEDFFALADQYGVLDQAKPWISEFYAALKEKPVIAKSRPVTQTAVN